MLLRIRGYYRKASIIHAFQNEQQLIWPGTTRKAAHLTLVAIFILQSLCSAIPKWEEIL